MKKEVLGTVIVDMDTPNPSSFSFVLTTVNELTKVKKGTYVVIPTEDGEIVSTVHEIYKTNRYFSSPSAVKAYETSGKTLASIFPSDKWEYIICKAKPLGVMTKIGIKRLLYPVSPGDAVYAPDNETLNRFLGFDKEHGLFIGRIGEHDLDVKLNLTRFLQKHAALLAISGAGKSYTASVLMEELLSRTPEKGRIALILFDVHGEYKGLASDDSPYKSQVEIIQGALLQFSTPQISATQFSIFEPDITPVQVRELHKMLSKMYKEKIKNNESYAISDIIKEIEANENMNQRSREALLGWFYGLETTRLFGNHERPDLEKDIKQGKILIIDLSDFTSLKQKQMIVSYMLYRLFDLRRKGVIPPTTVIIEEAHQFAPESSINLGLSKPIIETIAREGRKFFLSLLLISQRPVKLSTTALSQCNTHILMRLLNPYDLDYIGRSSEGIDRATLDMITSLGVGEGVITGNAVNYPIFLSIRERKTKSLEGRTLEEEAKSFEVE